LGLAFKTCQGDARANRPLTRVGIKDWYMTPQPMRFDIVISGASFAGMALALAAARAFDGELSIAVIDRMPQPASSKISGARAFAISAASQQMLSTLGIWAEVAHTAQPVTAIDITDSPLDAGIRPVVLSYDNRTVTGEPATHIVPAAEITNALQAAVAQVRSIRFIAPAEVRRFHAEGAMATLELSDGQTLLAALAVAAEGRASALRDMAGIKSVRWAYDQTGIVALIAHERPHGGRAVQHFLPAGPFAILPLTGNRSCVTWTEEAAEAARILALDDSGFLDEVDQRFGGRLGQISLEGTRQSWPLDLHLARSYSAPRLAVIGDAAHSVHPIAGQGLNLGLRDAAALIDVVADAARLGLDIGARPVLERYEQWRRFDSTVSALSFDGLNRLFSNDSTVLRAARDAGLGLVDRMPSLKQAFVREASGLSGELPRLLRGEPV
jgi:2-octaprenyl-6-methoxyphenol hydroxylase